MEISELLDEPLAWDPSVVLLMEAAVEPVDVAPSASTGAPLGEWLALIAAREDRAMYRLHDNMRVRLHGVVARIVPDASLTDEVVGESFWQIWREAARFDVTRGSPIGWMTTIARSRALDAMRRRKALAKHEEPLTDEQADAWACDDDECPSRRLELQQRKRCLADALARLDPIHRQMLSQSFIDGLSHEQIAAHCGMPLGTVKSHIRRGLTLLRVHCERAGLQP